MCVYVLLCCWSLPQNLPAALFCAPSRTPVVNRELGRLVGHGPTFILRLEGPKALLITHLRVFIPNPVFSTPSDSSQRRFLFVGLFLSSYGSAEVAFPTHSPHLTWAGGVQVPAKRASSALETFSTGAFCVRAEHSSLWANAAPAHHLSDISAQDKWCLWRFLIIS